MKPVVTSVTLVFNTDTEGHSSTCRGLFLDADQAKKECGPGYNYETGWAIVFDDHGFQNRAFILKGGGWSPPSAVDVNKDWDREQEEAVKRAKDKLDEDDLKALGLKR